MAPTDLPASASGALRVNGRGGLDSSARDCSRVPDVSAQSGRGAPAPPDRGSRALLRVERVSKRFGVVQAIANVTVDFRPGEIHALLGENGAGKTTLTRIIGGLFPPDSGRLVWEEEPVRWSSPAQALARGIGIAHQEFNLVPDLTVGANAFLGHEPRRRLGGVDDGAIRRRTNELLARLDAPFDASALVSELSVAEQQLAEIARVLNRDPRLLILDEPTASLSAEASQKLFEVIRSLREQGIAIVYISHELEDVFELSDRVTVLKDGSVMMTKPTSETDQAEAVRTMVGRKLDELFPAPRTVRRREGTPALAVSGLTLPGRFWDVTFDVHPGEVVGFAGLIGAGRSDVALALFGALPPGVKRHALRGSVFVRGEEVRIASPRAAAALGIGLVPEDRKGEGLILDLSLAENLALAQLERLSHAGVLDRRRQDELASEQVAALRIDARSPHTAVRYLSGGNQQKTTLAKWLARDCSILILDEPTRGVDIGAKVEIYHFIRGAADLGTAVMLISSSLPEVIGLSDRIVVMAKGRIVAEHTAETASEETLLTAALGLAAEEREEDGLV